MSFYRTLGVEPGCSKDEIRKNYKRLAIKHHPDKEGGDAEEFKKLAAAYEVLSDESSRARYDQVGDHGWNQQHQQQHQQPQTGHDPMDMFAQMFAGMGMNMNMGGMGSPPSHPQNQVKRADHSHVVEITLKEAFHGVTRTLRVSLPTPCLSCAFDCGECKGKGVYNQVLANGMFHQIVRVQCSSCEGSGQQRHKECNGCKSTGSVQRFDQITVKIPRGTRSGHTEKFLGFGEQKKRETEVAGDLLVEIRITEDPTFQRNGDDLHHNVKISLWDSIVGAKVVVPMLDNDVTVNTRDFGSGIVQPGKRYALGGGGMPILRTQGEGQGSEVEERGALVLSFEVLYPDARLTDGAKDLLVECFRIINKA